jgi:hypothetical protein
MDYVLSIDGRPIGPVVDQGSLVEAAGKDGNAAEAYSSAASSMWWPPKGDHVGSGAFISSVSTPAMRGVPR